MAYKFTCTSCGRNLTQERTLYEIFSLLTKDLDFHCLKLLLTEEELLEFVAKTDVEKGANAAMGRRKFQLPFERWIKIIANAQNLDIAELAGLKPNDFNEFIDYEPEKVDEAKIARREIKALDYDKAGLEIEKQKVEAEYQAALKREMNRVKERNAEAEARMDRFLPFVKGDRSLMEKLREELRFLRMLSGNSFEIQTVVSLKMEAVDNGSEKILTGLQTFNTEGKSIRNETNHRRCPGCGKPLFIGAGTAPQRTVVFIGSQKTGKTSAILAGAHYLLKWNDGRVGRTIWKDAEPKPCHFVEDRTAEERFAMELDHYSEGFAPAKTAVDTIQIASGRGQPAYSVTLKISDERGRDTFLSMMDVPGEICNDEEDRIDESLIEDGFQVLYSSDAYVLCFEHPDSRYKRRKAEAEQQRVNQQAEAAKDPSVHVWTDYEVEKYACTELTGGRVCGWLQQIQSGRKNRYDSRVPVLLLFTKCENLEKATEEELRQSGREGHYIFASEQAVLDNEIFFQEVLQHISRARDLNECYRAALRCSPYGTVAEEKKDNVVPVQPKPKNVDLMMKWILRVTGCVSVALDSFKGMKGAKAYVKAPENRELLPDEKHFGRKLRTFDVWLYPITHYTNRELKRAVAPIAEIAMMRWILFENFKDSERRYAQERNDAHKFFNAVVAAHKERDARETMQKNVNGARR